MFRYPKCMRFAAVVLFCSLLMAAAAQSTETKQRKSILLLYSYGHGSKGVDIFDEGMLDTLYANGYKVTDLYFEYLDLERRKGDSLYFSELKKELERKYPKGSIDLVFTGQQPARNFLLKEGAGIAPAVQVLTFQAPPPTEAEAGDRIFNCILAQFDVSGTVKLALQAFPSTKNILVVVGESDADRNMMKTVEKAVEPFSPRVGFEYTTGVTYDDLLKRAASTSPDTIILFTQFNKDSAGRVTVAYEVEAALIKAANAPVFGLYDFNLRNGGVGGSVVSVHGLGVQTAQLMDGILEGRHKAAYKVNKIEVNVVPMFDWSKIKEWGGRPENLPPETVFLNKEPTIFESYKWYILGFGGLAILQMTLIVVLLEMRRRQMIAEERMKESEERYRTIFNRVSDSIFVLELSDDQLPIIVELNEIAATSLGYKREDLIGKPITYIDPDPDFATHNQRRVGEIDATGGSVFEVVHKAKSGETRHFECNTRAFQSKDKRIILSAERDVTERRVAEHEILKLSQRLDLAIRSADIGIWDWDIETNTMLWDDRMIEMYGYTKETYPGGFEAWKSKIHPGDAKRVENELNQALSGEKDWDIEFRIAIDTAEARYVKAYGQVIRDDSGKPKRMLGINFDTTASRKAEEEKSALEEQLVQAQKMESVGKLAGGVAHDFNNMLGVILGHTELILGQIDADNPLKADLDEIQNAATRSAEITRQLLAFARKQTVAPKVLDLNVSLEPMMKMIQRIIGEDVNLSWKPGEDLWKVRIDPSQVDQIIANLAGNARDAINGVGHLTIETSNEFIDRPYSDLHPGFKPGSYVVLTVSDDGVGISRDKLSNIFDPFFTTKEMGKGTGLGLATVYGIVKQNSGFINVYSEPGNGATFRIYLPRVDGMVEPTETVQAKAVGGSETVLVVEDEDASLRLLKRYLASIGYNVLAADGPVQAIAIANSKETPKIDLLLTDVVLPDMNGRNLADELRKMIPNMKCLFMSGYTANVIAHRGVLDKGVNFIQKPYGLNDMGAKVREVLDS